MGFNTACDNKKNHSLKRINQNFNFHLIVTNIKKKKRTRKKIKFLILKLEIK